MRIVYYYSRWIYPWGVHLLDTLRRKGEQVTLQATEMFGNYPAIKRVEKDIHKIPLISFLGENIIHPKLFLHVLLSRPKFLVIVNSEGLPLLPLYITAKVGKIPTVPLVEKDKDTRYLLPLRI